MIKGRKTVTIKIGDGEFKHEVLVADIMDEVILGMDFMKNNGFILDIQQGLLRYSNIELPLRMNEESPITARRVVMEHRVRLPPNAESVIWGRLEGDSGTNRLWVMEAGQNIGTKEIIVGKALITPDSDLRIPIRALNLSDKTKTIKKGTIIGNCEEVSAIIKCEQQRQPTKDNTLRQREIVAELTAKWTGQVTTEQQRAAQELLEKYSSVFCCAPENNGRTNLVKHQINTGTETPIRQAPRRLPLAKQGEVSEMVTDMQTAGVIETSTSPWSSPVVLVKKKDGSMRFCVDYRKLNDVTKKDSYPLPRIDDTLDTLSGAKVFSTLNLQSGYWQVEVQEEDKEKTAFSVGNGLWQFNVMPFGLCNAPATFERLMERVLKGLHWRTCLVYLDDIIVMGKNFEEHLENLGQVLERIQAAGLKLSPKKCSLF